MKKGLKKTIISLVLVFALLFVSCIPAFAIELDFKSACKTKYVAHRGYSGLYPQNTVPAFEKAVEAGFWGVECDIHTTKDGKWVVIHDGEISDLTNGSGEVSELTFEEIQQFKMDSGNGIENYGELPIPTLEEYLDVCLTGDIVPVIEIKGWEEQYLPSLIATVEEYGLSSKAVIISFDEDALIKYRELDSDATIYLLGKPSPENIDLCREQNFGINTNYGDFLKMYYGIIYAKLTGVPVATWTVDQAFVAFLLRILGAQIITSNVLH